MDKSTATQHTPGPWTYRSIPGHLFEITDSEGNPILRIRGGMMPTLGDANLLAAAPEMLSALREIADPFSHPLAKPESVVAALRLIAVTAIRKATEGV